MTAAQDLWALITGQLRSYLSRAVQDLLPQLGSLETDDAKLNGRLLEFAAPPPGHPVADLIREIAGAIDVDSPVRIHGWRRAAGAPLGLALVVTDPNAAGRLAAAAFTPVGGGAIIDVVVEPGGQLVFSHPDPPGADAEWVVTLHIDPPPNGWNIASGPGVPANAPGGTATVTVERRKKIQAGMTTGPGLRLKGFAVTVTGTAPNPPTVAVELRKLEVAILPPEIARLVGASSTEPAQRQGDGEVTVTVEADRVQGVRFGAGGSLRVGVPLRIKAPGLQARGSAVTLFESGGEFRLGLITSLTASLPGLPLKASISDTGFSVPLAFLDGKRPQLDAAKLAPITPDGAGVDLTLPPVSGGGFLRKSKDGGYGGIIAIDLGVLGIQAVAIFRPPDGSNPTSFVVLLAVQFPPPGIQLSFGFALDAVGGLVGINRRVDAGELRNLVSDGHADRILFPDNAVGRANEVLDALTAVFPVAAGRFVIAPMVRITWGGRMVSLSGALILELPAPVQTMILGRLLVSVPDPLVPLIRLQASILGRFDPGVPLFELLVSLAGSWIVGLAVRGEIYLLVRGGDHPEFVLSAGGFHPRYVRPAGVPELDRLQMDLRPSPFFGMRLEAYFAVTSNAVQFGGQLHLEAMIAKCGVEGWLGLDALFRFEPTFSFSVHVYAGVAVRAFGRRLAGIGLDFTLEGPAPWHAFGTGSISILFWDVDLGFDIAWGAPPAVTARIVADDLSDPVRQAIGKPHAWVVEKPGAERTGLSFTREAKEQITAGTLVHPDASFRVSQAVVPLDVSFTRYSRRRVAEQTWTIVSVQVGASTKPADQLDDIVDRFVRGELFDLTEDEQLSAPPMVTQNSGKHISAGGFQLGSGHRVDDTYETGYEPKPEDHVDGKLDFRKWPGTYAVEASLVSSPAERLHRWRPASVTVGLRPPSLTEVSGTAMAPLNAMLIAPAPEEPAAPPLMPAPDTVVESTVDLWGVMRDQLRDPSRRTRFLEAWEVPA